MKKLLLILGTILLLAISCSKPENGKDGKEGNANVTQYNFASRTFTGLTTYQIPNFTQEKLDNSVVLCYYFPTIIYAWYNVPGIGANVDFISRSFYAINNITNLNIEVKLLNSNFTAYTTSTTFDKFKVIIIPNSTVITAKLSNQPDFKNMSYHEVCSYLNIAE